MDRCAVFVDAGYLLAAGGELCCGTPSRRQLDCKYEEIAGLLVRVATEHAKLPLLRAYWYDAGRNAQADSQQLRIASVPSFKLRLGRLSGGEQKGVDALIIRDLMTLSRERAMAVAYLLSGDEDLREGVVAAQDMGVRVILLGVLPSLHQNQAATLIREADEHILLSKDDLNPYISRLLLPARPLSPAVQPQVFVAQPVQAAVTATSPVTPADQPVAVAPAPATPTLPTAEDIATIERAANEFTQSWARAASDAQLKAVLLELPKIPRDLDIQLVVAVSSALGRRIIGDLPFVRPMRLMFWKTLKEVSNGRRATAQLEGRPPEL